VSAPRRSVPVAIPLAVWERDGLAAALGKAGLPAEDVRSEGPLFWRFESDDTPVGFGGLQLFGDQALLRSVVILPPLRNRGIGSMVVEGLETEAQALGCTAVWTVTDRALAFFNRLGYRACEPAEAPAAVRDSISFRGAAAKAVCFTKQLG
jgi:N-acetylglutamate synthase-like GNAT family acetyltransferase